MTAGLRTTSVWLALAAASGSGGCFNPTYNNPMCGPAGECPGSLTCVDNVCRDLANPDDDGGAGADACVGRQCDVVDCVAQGMKPTSISGKVHAPNGTLPLYGVDVYVPNDAVPAITDGVSCGRCAATLPGNPVAHTTTNEKGEFVLTNVPVGADIPLVISIGKWRRELTLGTVGSCTDHPLTVNETRLPSNRAEGHIPRIALSTGAADTLECLLRKLGIADSEFGTLGGPQRIHLYAPTGTASGANTFATGFPGGSGAFAASQTTLWHMTSALSAYDLVMLSCEGQQHAAAKPQPAMDAMKAYADAGGRILMTHWHNIWISGSTMDGSMTQAPAVWTSIAMWANQASTDTPPNQIDEVNNPKGPAFATWLLETAGVGVRGQIPITQGSGRQTAKSVDEDKADRWVLWPGGGILPQSFMFTTPNESAANARCGKVMFSDMHMSTQGSAPGVPFPNHCPTSSLTPQEKALAFMFFDLGDCIEP